MYLQTGDVLYKQSECIPNSFKPVEGGKVYQGRDHSHMIEGVFQLYTKGDEMFIKAKDSCQLTHPEHKTITLPPGIWKREIVREYDHVLEESRKVID